MIEQTGTPAPCELGMYYLICLSLSLGVAREAGPEYKNVTPVVQGVHSSEKPPLVYEYWVYSQIVLSMNHNFSEIS